MNSIPEPAPGEPRVGAVAVIVREEKFLAICRAPGIVAAGAYCFPGGALEVGESDEQAMVREVLEELGVLVVPVRRLWSSTTAWQVALTWWLAELPPRAEFRPDPAEVAEIAWFRPEELAAHPDLLESNRHFLAAWRSGAFSIDGLTP